MAEGSKLILTGPKVVWLLNWKPVYKVIRFHVIRRPHDEENSSISKSLLKLSPLDSRPPHTFFTVEVLGPNYPRGISGQFDESIAKEIIYQLRNKFCEVVEWQEIADDVNVFVERFVLAINNKGTNYDTFKPTYFAYGCLGKGQRNSCTQLYDSQSTSRQPTSFARYHSFFLISSDDMTLPYLQRS